MSRIYLLLAILGAVVPYVFFIDWFRSQGFGLQDFVAGGFVNGAAGGFTADVLISSLAFWIWLASRKTAQLWQYIVVNLLIGLSCALPLYLYRQARASELTGHQKVTTA